MQRTIDLLIERVQTRCENGASWSLLLETCQRLAYVVDPIKDCPCADCEALRDARKLLQDLRGAPDDDQSHAEVE